jgi:hypothetical protein
MEMVIENFNIELRKLIAIKFEQRNPLEREYHLPINVSIDQEEDKYKIYIYSSYAINDIDINIEIDFIGKINLKEPYNIWQKGDPLIKEMLETKILPRIVEAINNILSVLTIKMNIKIKEIQWRY